MTLAHQHLEGSPWSLSGSTGTMAAALAANSVVFAMGAIADTARISQPIQRAPVEIEAMRVTFTAIVAATTPVTAGRFLRLFKGSDNAQVLPTGGADITPIPKRTKDQTADTGLQAGVARIATTAALTTTGFTRGSVPLATMDLTGLGAAGSRFQFEFFFEKRQGSPLWLDPGEILVISNPSQIDAALTWQLTVDVDYRSRDTM